MEVKLISTLPIAFYEWCQDNNWHKYPKVDRWVRKGYDKCKLTGKKREITALNPKTGEELFELFLIDYKPKKA